MEKDKKSIDYVVQNGEPVPVGKSAANGVFTKTTYYNGKLVTVKHRLVNGIHLISDAYQG